MTNACPAHQPGIAAKLAGPAAFVLLQICPILRVLAVSHDPDLLEREAETLIAQQAERGDRTLFTWVIQAAPQIRS